MNTSLKRSIILIVDDTRDNIEIMSIILSPSYRIKIALNGDEALRISQSSEPPDLVLLDIMMPGMDGYEVCKRLKEDPKTRKIPVIFVSAKSEDFDEVKGLTLGAVDYFTKPVTPVIVEARVKTHLLLASSLRELEKQNEIFQENLRLQEEIERIARHDLRSPLTAVINIPEMLISDPNLKPGQVEMLEILAKSGIRMMEMVNRTLDLGKMERGQYRVNPVPVDLIKIAHQIFREFSSPAKRKNIVDEVLLDGKPPDPRQKFELNGEEFLFFSMLSNLVKNAIEAAPEGSLVQILLSREPVLQVQVKNQGVIPEPIRDRFFERYATYGKKSGTGLGSYSARLMARTLGGDLSFTTSTEQGTAIQFRFRTPEKVQGETGSGPAEKRPGSPLGGDVPILVLNDCPYMRQIIVNFLHPAGYLNLFEAQEKETAIRIIQESRIDLVISGWGNPGNTGRNFLEFIRKSDQWRNIPVLVISEETSNDSIRAAFDQGISGFLAKPFTPDQLLTSVEKALGPKHA